MNCQQCGEKHDKKGLYCSKRCCDKAYRERKKSGKTPEIKPKKVIDFKKKIQVKIPKETGPKLKWCMYCGNTLEHSPKLRFCNETHERSYWETVKEGRSLKISIDPRTLIVTKKYEKVQELIESMLSRQSYYVPLS